MKSCNKTREQNKELKAREVHFGLAVGKQNKKETRPTGQQQGNTGNCMISQLVIIPVMAAVAVRKKVVSIG